MQKIFATRTAMVFGGVFIALAAIPIVLVVRRVGVLIWMLGRLLIGR